jgi:NAD(P)-dependent dehydrogenase (short-subunit alcohol dehydrogenase family)
MEIAGAFGRVHALFSGIGVNPNTEALDIPPEEWANVMSVNVNGQFYIAIGSNFGFIVDRPQPHYNASKAAVRQMVKFPAAAGTGRERAQGAMMTSTPATVRLAPSAAGGAASVMRTSNC